MSRGVRCLCGAACLDRVLLIFYIFFLFLFSVVFLFFYCPRLVLLEQHSFMVITRLQFCRCCTSRCITVNFVAVKKFGLPQLQSSGCYLTFTSSGGRTRGWGGWGRATPAAPRYKRDRAPHGRTHDAYDVARVGVAIIPEGKAAVILVCPLCECKV